MVLDEMWSAPNGSLYLFALLHGHSVVQMCFCGPGTVTEHKSLSLKCRHGVRNNIYIHTFHNARKIVFLLGSGSKHLFCCCSTFRPPSTDAWIKTV